MVGGGAPAVCLCGGGGESKSLAATICSWMKKLKFKALSVRIRHLVTALFWLREPLRAWDCWSLSVDSSFHRAVKWVTGSVVLSTPVRGSRFPTKGYFNFFLNALREYWTAEHLSISQWLESGGSDDDTSQSVLSWADSLQVLKRTAHNSSLSFTGRTVRRGRLLHLRVELAVCFVAQW